MDEPKLLNQGAYGCAYKPYIQCDGQSDEDYEKTKNDYISKIAEEKFIDKELKEMENINKIDVNNIYTLPSPIICEINRNIRQYIMFRNCGIYSSGKHFQNLLYKYGGIDIRHVVKHHKKYLTYNPHLYSEFMRIIYGLYDMKQHGFIHNDVHNGNILYKTKKDKKMRYIDFGLSEFVYNNLLKSYGLQFVTHKRTQEVYIDKNMLMFYDIVVFEDELKKVISMCDDALYYKPLNKMKYEDMIYQLLNTNFVRLFHFSRPFDTFFQCMNFYVKPNHKWYKNELFYVAMIKLLQCGILIQYSASMINIFNYRGGALIDPYKIYTDYISSLEPEYDEEFEYLTKCNEYEHGLFITYSYFARDIYCLGECMYKIITLDNTIDRRRDFIEFIKKMSHPNIFRRLSIEEVFIQYYELLSFYSLPIESDIIDIVNTTYVKLKNERFIHQHNTVHKIVEYINQSTNYKMKEYIMNECMKNLMKLTYYKSKQESTRYNVDLIKPFKYYNIQNRKIDRRVLLKALDFMMKSDIYNVPTNVKDYTDIEPIGHLINMYDQLFSSDFGQELSKLEMAEIYTYIKILIMICCCNSSYNAKSLLSEDLYLPFISQAISFLKIKEDSGSYGTDEEIVNGVREKMENIINNANVYYTKDVKILGNIRDLTLSIEQNIILVYLILMSKILLQNHKYQEIQDFVVNLYKTIPTDDEIIDIIDEIDKATVIDKKMIAGYDELIIERMFGYISIQYMYNTHAYEKFYTKYFPDKILNLNVEADYEVATIEIIDYMKDYVLDVIKSHII